jgi:DNA-binding GntR family transcriptional regulator
MTSSDVDARPLYEQVAAALRAAIEQGELQPGSAVPSEADLRERHNVSRDTVRKALALLAQEGLITSGQGKARYVRAYSPLRWSLSSFECRDRGDSADAVDAWALHVRNQGRQPSETIEVGIVVPPTRVLERLRLDPASGFAVVRRRVRYVDEKPYQLADSYFPEEIVRGTLLMEPRSVSAPGGLLAAIGYTQVRFVDEIAIRMPTATETERLGLPTGTPVAEVTRTGYAADGKPLRTMVSIAPGDRNVLVYEIGID